MSRRLFALAFNCPQRAPCRATQHVLLPKQNIHAQQFRQPRKAAVDYSPHWCTRACVAIIFLEEKNLVVAADYDGVIRVYDVDTAGEPRAVFERHNEWACDVVQLHSDVVASVGSDGHLFTWRAAIVELVGEWKHSAALQCVAKLDESKIIVGDWSGNVTVLTHLSAASFQVYRRLNGAHSQGINAIDVHDQLFFTCSDSKTVKVWDAKKLTLVATLPHANCVSSIAVSDRNIITTSYGAKLCVFHNAADYKLRYQLKLPVDQAVFGDVAFLNDDVLVVPAKHYLYFISLRNKSVLSRVRLGKKLFSFKVLSDGRIAVGGKDGYCVIIEPPKSVQGAVEDCIADLHPSSAIAAGHGIRTARHVDQSRQSCPGDGRNPAVIPKSCVASLEEWCFAPRLFMEGVKHTAVAAPRPLDESSARWHQVLYRGRSYNVRVASIGVPAARMTPNSATFDGGT